MNNLNSIEWRTQKKDVFIQWDDLHESSYAYFYLRSQCPCVLCKDKKNSNLHSDLSSMIHKLSQDNVELSHIEPIGNYALRFLWNDGHNTGIYSLEFLRSVCPCNQCQKL